MGDQVTLNTISDGIEFTDEKHASHDYSERARRHLWLQMSRMGAYDEHNEVPIMVRGEGTRVFDANGTEYFDGLSGLFTNMLGHGRADIAAAAAEQMTSMAFFPLWTYAHPKAIELAEKIASLAPGDQPCLFHLGWCRSERERLETRASVPQDARGHRSLQGHQP
jgi:acetylornithine/succinyldiaminopimelate/putrescine aminotransferase